MEMSQCWPDHQLDFLWVVMKDDNPDIFDKMNVLLSLRFEEFQFVDGE